MDLMSYIKWCDVLKSECDVIERRSDVMNAVFVMPCNMIIDVIKCECDVMSIGYDVIRVPSVMTYTLVVMSLIQRYNDTGVCAICVMTHIQWLWCQKWRVRCQV